MKTSFRAMFHALVAGSVLWHCSSDNNPSVHVDELWGFADLHAHPAFHLAYGAAIAGTSDLDQSGIMYGLPGMALDAGTEDADLKPCDADTHGKANPIANILLTQLAAVLKTPHGMNGYPSFDNWPLATAGLHQQMHVTWLHRAWQGGQRLMVASVVENALLAAAFSGHLSLPGSPEIHDAEKTVAFAQVDFITKLAQANSTWLEVVKDPGAAEIAIRNGKMALVLGTEFDTLDEQEMSDLWDVGVRVFIPIHLADNALGGTAVYTDVFNIHSAYVNKVGYTIAHDDDLTFELGIDIPPLDLLGLPLPNPFVAANAHIVPGHRNARGLSDSGKHMIHALIDKGAIIDVAHMGQLSTDDTLTIAECTGVPVMDSHTGVRPSDEKTESERDLKYADAVRIGKLGGMIGISTGGNTSDTTVKTDRTFHSSPFKKLTVAQPTYSENLPPAPPKALCKGLVIGVWTANDDIRKDSTATVEVNGVELPLNHGFELDNHQSITRMIALPEGTMSTDVDVALLHHTSNDFWSGQTDDDKWNLGGVRLVCGPRAFAPDDDDKTKKLAEGGALTTTVDTTDATKISLVPIDVWTGDQQLDSSSQLDVDVHTKSGTPAGCTDLLEDPNGDRHGLPSHSQRHLVCVLKSPVAMNDIDKVSLRLTKGGSWNVEDWMVGLDDGAPPSATFPGAHDYGPPLEMKGEQRLFLTPMPVHGERMVRITIDSDTDGLEAGIEATATLHFSDGANQKVRLNRGAQITAGRADVFFKITVPIATQVQFYAVLDGDHHSTDIASLQIDAPGITHDWPITKVSLEAFDEPAAHWVADLEAVSKALDRRDADCFLPNGYCGIALGTDLNGMAPAIPGTSINPYDTTSYPGKVLLDYPAALGGRGTITAACKTGDKTWDVRSDGIAHVGMLPDFLVAAAHSSINGPRTIATVFHSAGEFVRMWKKIDMKKKTCDAGDCDAGTIDTCDAGKTD